MAPETLRILCFGDSLTDGYSAHGTERYPYSERLEARLRAVPQLRGTQLEIVTDGVPGDMVSWQRFAKRMEDACDRRWFDWVIVLGGTNDLGRMVPVDAIWNGLLATWGVPLSRNSNVLALTVIECHAKIAILDGRRRDLNSLILSHEQENFYSMDLKPKIPYHAMSEQDRKRCWDDGLHLRKDGYDLMGDSIADGLIPLLVPESAGPPKPVGKAQDGFGDDGVVLQEEEGNPRKINQGYIIVRKKDLD